MTHFRKCWTHSQKQTNKQANKTYPSLEKQWRTGLSFLFLLFSVTTNNRVDLFVKVLGLCTDSRETGDSFARFRTSKHSTHHGYHTNTAPREYRNHNTAAACSEGSNKAALEPMLFSSASLLLRDLEEAALDTVDKLALKIYHVGGTILGFPTSREHFAFLQPSVCQIPSKCMKTCE